MSTKAAPRGAICGRSYLGEYVTLELIQGLQDGARLLGEWFEATPPDTLLAHRLVRAENAVLRVARDLEDGLGNSADE